MRQLIGAQLGASNPLDADALAALVGAEPRGGSNQPWIMTNMVASLDGRISVDGVSAGLGGPGDRMLFGVLRAQADVVLIGAGTARAERYRMPRTPDGLLAEQRAARGQAPAPALAVVSASLELDGVPFVEETPLEETPLDGPASDRRLIITTATAPASRREALAGRCTIVEAGEDSVDPHLALQRLVEAGHRVILCEGGPVLLSDLVGADLIDEWNLTLAPSVLGEGPLMLRSGSARPLVLNRLLADDSHLLARYLVGQSRSEFGMSSC